MLKLQDKTMFLSYQTNGLILKKDRLFAKEGENNMYNYKIIENKYIEFYILNRKKEEFSVLVDLDIFEQIKSYSWHVEWKKDIDNNYISYTEYLGMFNGKPKYKSVYLHNFIINTPKGYFVDHINHNPFDNRKENLRLVCKSKNAMNRKSKNCNNTSGYRNVTWSKSENKWIDRKSVV